MPQPNLEQPCPCNPEHLYNNCCHSIHQNPKKAIKPEQLMRARYSAYVMANIDFIESTMLPPASDGFNAAEAKAWAERVKWLGLQVVKAKRIPNSLKGAVEFIATFEENGVKQTMHEKSQFIKKNGQWFYVDGK